MRGNKTRLTGIITPNGLQITKNILLAFQTGDENVENQTIDELGAMTHQTGDTLLQPSRLNPSPAPVEGGTEASRSAA